MSKRSYYTVLAPLDGGGVLYHTGTQAMATLDAAEVDLLHELDHIDGTVSCFDEEAQTFLSQLQDLGLLVDDPEVEADLMLYRHNRHRNNKKVLELTISPTRMCNFDCDYCYIKKRKGLMSEEVQDALIAFAERHYAKSPYQTLKVNWYGGEPLLALDIMESISTRFMEFCESRGVRYTAHVLSNGSLATKDVCRRLKKNCAVATFMPSISGNGIMHDWQRTAKDGKEHFSELMDNIDNMLEAGITVHANFVVNRNNFEECKELAVELNKKPGIVIRLTRTFAYGRNGFKLHDGKDTPLVFFGRAEFAPYYLDFHRALGLSATGYRDVMKPICMYCAAWHNNSFFVDEVGDVFACMQDMDFSTYALANVVDMRAGDEWFNWARFDEFANIEPARSQKCRRCSILPICQGGCVYCAVLGDDVCHDLRGNIEDFVLDYYRACRRR